MANRKRMKRGGDQEMAQGFFDLGFPLNTSAAQAWTSIIRQETPLPLSQRISSRMVKIAANLPEGEWIGWQALIPANGIVSFTAFGSKAIKPSDLDWIAEESADTEPLAVDRIQPKLAGCCGEWELYEVFLPIAEEEQPSAIGFLSEADGNDEKAALSHYQNYYSWPRAFADQFGELVEALRIEGGALRFVVGKASREERAACIRQVERTWPSVGDDISLYVGHPVRARLLLALPGAPAARVRANVGACVPGAELMPMGNLAEQAGKAAWKEPLADCRVLPDYAARIMAFEPIVGKEPVIGVEARDPEAKLVPARHKDSQRGTPIIVGEAIDISGRERQITIGDEDLRRHWQIIGQTGTGKSTLLASVISEAIQSGHGVTFFDPHGSTINFILRILPKEFAERVRVVRIGDSENPVPANMWETDDPVEAERTIADLCLLFQEIFDPKQLGFLGPRWERMFTLLAKASIAVFGKRASFESIVTLAMEKSRVNSAALIIQKQHSALADALQKEWVNNESKEFPEAIA